MNKKELIDRITHVNRSATREFLAEFSERELGDYLRQFDFVGTRAVPRPTTMPDDRSATDRFDWSS